MTAGQIIAYVVVPMAIFMLGAAGAGIVALVRFTVYLTKSREAQESTAKTNQKISDDLASFIGHTNERLNNHGERIVVLEDRAGIR